MILYGELSINAMKIVKNVKKNGQVRVLNVQNVKHQNLLFIEEIVLKNVQNFMILPRQYANVLRKNVENAPRKV